MAYFDNAKVGDDVVDTMTGEAGKIVELGINTIYPIVVDFGTYTIDGKGLKSHKLQRLFYKGYEPTITIPEPPKREHKFKSFKGQYSIRSSDIWDNVSGTYMPDYEYGLYRHTEEQVKASFERNKRANRLEMLVYDIQEEVGGNCYIYQNYNNVWCYDERGICLFPEAVYMYEDTAIKVCKILNNGEYEL